MWYSNILRYVIRHHNGCSRGHSKFNKSSITHKLLSVPKKLFIRREMVKITLQQSLYQYRGNISSIFFSNSETNVSELLKNTEQMFPWYYIHGDLSLVLVVQNI